MNQPHSMAQQISQSAIGFEERRLRNESLPLELLHQIKAVFDIVGPYTGKTLEQFEIEFMRDSDPENEVVVWQSIVATWQAYHEKFVSVSTLPENVERELLGALIVISAGVRNVAKLNVTAEVGRRLLQCYDDSRIRVNQTLVRHSAKEVSVRKKIWQGRLMEQIELADGGILLYEESFLPPDIANQYFIELRDHSAWEQKPTKFGNLQPPLTASYGDESVTFRNAEAENEVLPWTPTLLEIKSQIEAVQGEYNYCLLNRYRSGEDSVAWHADDEPGIGNVIGSLSLGATRKFRIRHKVKRRPMRFLPSNGTLIIMAGTMQQFWQHEVPKTTENVGERINLTFRKIEKE